MFSPHFFYCSQDKTNDSNASDEVQLTGHAEG